MADEQKPSEQAPVPAPAATVPEVPESKPTEQTPAQKMVEEEKYKAAVREMNLKQQEAALLRKELELVRKEKGTAPSAPQQPQEIPDHVKRQLEEKYGVPYGQIQLINDMMELKNPSQAVSALKQDLEELTGTIYEDRFENKKSLLKSQDIVFQEFEPEIEARLRQLPPRKRLDPQEIQRVRAEVISDPENFNRILQLAEERGRQSVTAKPPTMPEVAGVTGGGGVPPVKPKYPALTAEQIAAAQKFGVDVQAVSDVVAGKVKPSGWLNHLK